MVQTNSILNSPKTNLEYMPISANKNCKAPQKSPAKSAKTGSSSDSFEKRPLTKAQKAERAKIQRTYRAWANRIIGALAATGIILGGSKIANNMQEPSPNFNAAGHTLEETAQWTDIDPRAISIANDIDNPNMALDEIILPEVYDGLSDEISSLEEKLEDNTITEEETEQLKELKDKKEYQDSLASAYSLEDGTVIILPNEYGVSGEEIKDAFGIKDGVLKENNDLYYSWEKDEEGYGYKDYTGHSIPYSGVVVPECELNRQ